MFKEQYKGKSFVNGESRWRKHASHPPNVSLYAGINYTHLKF